MPSPTLQFRLLTSVRQPAAKTKGRIARCESGLVIEPPCYLAAAMCYEA